MSVKLVFSVFDCKAQAFLTPIFCPTRGVAVRMFQAAVVDEGHDFHRFAEDYTLFELGDFDEQSAKFDLYSTPESVVIAAALLAATEERNA